MAQKRAPDPPESDIPSNPHSAMFFAYASIGVVFAAAIAVPGNRFFEMWNWPGTPPFSVQTALFIARIALFTELVLWAARWIIATRQEAKWWVTYLHYKQEPTEAFASMLALALFLGLLMAFAHHIVIVSGLFTTGLLLNYYTQSYCNDVVSEQLDRAREESEQDARLLRILGVMRDFWLVRHQLARITTMMFVASVAFSLALAGAVQADPMKAHFELAAYIVLISDVLVAELIIYFWRRDLKRGITEVWTVGE